MTLRWVPDGMTGQALRGLDAEGRYVGQVVRYDLPPGWRGFVRGYPVTGRWREQGEAQVAVEGVVERSLWFGA